VAKKEDKRSGKSNKKSPFCCECCQKELLQAVIDEYISSAEPVGSRAISKKNELGLSKIYT
jgi:hypothetical protein